MKIHFHHHALERMEERGATEDEVRATVELGERFVEVYAVEEGPQEWLVITIVTRYF